MVVTIISGIPVFTKSLNCILPSPTTMVFEVVAIGVTNEAPQPMVTAMITALGSALSLAAKANPYREKQSGRSGITHELCHGRRQDKKDSSN